MERFRKLKSLGRGQAGEVWLVEREDASLAALKQIYIDSDESLNQEVSLLQRLSHPCIIQYQESFKSGSYLYIITDFAEGGDLGSRIRSAKNKGNKFSESQIWKWFGQISAALAYIHSHKIIHRDLKTQNIFLSKAGDIKIGDFGISRILSHSAEMACSSVGTPYYIAPEVCKGQPYDFKADVWSFGCIMYELCALRRPFEGDNIANVLKGILENQPQPIEGIAEGLSSIIFEMLRKDANSRPSVSDLLTVAEKRESRGRKSYLKEISIRIPTPTNAPGQLTPAPFNTPSEKPPLTGTFSQREKVFNFNESLLKQCPNSPIRPMLIGDFLKKKFGEEAFERLRRFIVNSKDPAKVLKEEPWIFSSICGEDSLSFIDVAISCGVFGNREKTEVNKSCIGRFQRNRPFPVLARHASQ
jgi:serine/threonine protein kinase